MGLVRKQKQQNRRAGLQKLTDNSLMLLINQMFFVANESESDMKRKELLAHSIPSRCLTEEILF